MFQFTTQPNGTVAAVEVSGNGTGATATVNGSTVTATAKKTLRSLDVAVGTDALYNGKLLTNSATIFLIRSGNGDTVSFTYKSVTGINAIGNYVQGEVDYVDLNDDGVADYVYIIAAPTPLRLRVCSTMPATTTTPITPPLVTGSSTASWTVLMLR